MRTLAVIMLSLVCVANAQIKNSTAAYAAAFLGSRGSVDTNLWTLPVAGYTLWLTPQYSNTMFTNGIGTVQTVNSGAIADRRVGKWVDKSTGGTNHVYEIGNNAGNDTRPYLTNSVAFNNQPILQMYSDTAIGNCLIQSNTTSLGGSNVGSCTAFIVARFMPNPSSSEQYGTPFSFNNVDAAGSDYIGFRRNIAAQEMTAFDCASGANAGSAIGTNLACVYGLRFSNSLNSYQLWTNLGLASTTSSSCNLPGSTGRVNIGCLFRGPDSRFDSELADVIYYPFELTNTEMTNMLTALKNKYIPAAAAGPDTNGLTFAMVGADYDGLPNGTTTNNIIDRSTNNLTGVMNGGNPFATNAIGVKGLQFNGTDAWWAATNVTAGRLLQQDEVTIAMYYMQLGGQANNGCFGFAGATYGMELLGTYSDVIYWDFSDNAGGRLSTAQPSGWDNTWHSVILRRATNGDQDIYVDGTQLDQQSKTGTIPSTEVGGVNIGANQGQPPSILGNIIVRHVRVYRNAKSNAERTALKTWMESN